ncbi:MAG: alpha-glucosidase [Acholeplasmataceae bacterium]|nr:alpha-glucosidase [Acholeplasmataceae bacterium]
MITFNTIQDGIEIRYKNQIIIKHTKDKPAFFLGFGTEIIESYRGNYQFDDYIESRIPLVSYKINQHQVIFFNQEIELTLDCIESDGRLIINFNSSQPFNRFWMRIFATKDEKIYGCGEQASYFNLRKRNFPLWTSEPGVGRDKKSLTTFYADLNDKAGGDYYTTYYPEPTFVSTRKYWLHVDSFAYADFNFKHDNFHELFFWETPRQLILNFKDNYLDLVTDLTDYTKRPPRLPEYLLDGMVIGVQGGLEQVLTYLKQSQAAGVKVSGIWAQDWAGHNYTSFGKRLYWNWKLNETIYPNLKEEIKKLGKENVAFLTYICPFLLENESLFNEAKSHNYLALTKTGEVYKEDFGEFYCGIVDLTNPKAFDWYKNVIKTNLIDLGIKGWMADFGEYLPVDCVLHNGIDAKLMHNEWPVLWAKCNYEAVKESNKLGEVFYFMRAGAHGSQHYATSLWAGDQSVNWETHDGIASVIPSALSTGIIGNPFTHSDIGGYTSLHGNIRTKELFDRWLEMNVFTSYMRTHEGNRPAQNFQFYNDDDTLQLMARMTSIRVDLKPYIHYLYDDAILKGYPVQRPLFMHYENDEKTYDLQYEYLFGPDIYIKPVVQPNQRAQELYLPQDEWIHLWSGESYQGGQTVTILCPIGYPPVFYRKDSNFAKLFEDITRKYHV